MHDQTKSSHHLKEKYKVSLKGDILLDSPLSLSLSLCGSFKRKTMEILKSSYQWHPNPIITSGLGFEALWSLITTMIQHMCD